MMLRKITDIVSLYKPKFSYTEYVTSVYIAVTTAPVNISSKRMLHLVYGTL